MTSLLDAEDDFSSDEDDVDYVPSDGDGGSEEELSGEDETGEGDDTGVSKKGKIKKKKKTKNVESKRKRKGLLMLEEEDGNANNEPADDEASDRTSGDTEAEVSLDAQVKLEKQAKQAEKQKQKTDDLWASFLKDVGGPVKPKPVPSGSVLGAQSSVRKSSATTESPKPAEHSAEKKVETNIQKKVTITKVFDFAGEEVKVTKEVDANSKEAKEAQAEQEKEVTAPTSQPISLGSKRPAGGGGGLGSVLGKIGKKAKISTLDKSKLDWNSFKKDEGIDEELQIHNRGKSGYIERQAFLQRADLRQFEIEKELRQSASKKLV